MNPTCRADCSQTGTCIHAYLQPIWLKKCIHTRTSFPEHGMALSPELVADLSGKLSQVQEGDRLVKTVHAAISQLESQGHVYTMQLQPTMVGISRQNRDGSGINPVDVHDLLGDIVSAGWLDARVQAIAHEPTGQEDIDWNVRLFESMRGRCGPIEPKMIKAQLQLMRRLHQTWVQMSSQGAVDFLALKNKVTTGKSVHSRSMPHLYNFVLKTAGGTDPFLLNETETFVRLHSPSTRSLGPAFWEKVSADVRGSNQFPLPPKLHISFSDDCYQA